MTETIYPCPACGATHTLHYTLCMMCRNASPAPDTDASERLEVFDRPNPPAMCRDGHETIYFGEDTEQFSDCPLCVARAQLAEAEAARTAESASHKADMRAAGAHLQRIEAERDEANQRVRRAEARSAEAHQRWSGEQERERALRWAWENWPNFTIGLSPGLPVKREESSDGYVARGLAALRADTQVPERGHE